MCLWEGKVLWETKDTMVKPEQTTAPNPRKLGTEEESLEMYLAFIDLKKAFDRTDREILSDIMAKER